jgi:hypothetical protein
MPNGFSKVTEREEIADEIFGAEDGAFEEGKIYCANCIHCKLVPTPGDQTGQFYLRVRCDAGKWKKKLGGEKQYKYFTVTRRSIDCCDVYEPMGEPAEFISDLRRTLPIRDELYDKE